MMRRVAVPTPAQTNVLFCSLRWKGGKQYVNGIVEVWNNIRGHGKIRIDEPGCSTLALCSRKDLGGGHFLSEGQNVRAMKRVDPNKPGAARFGRITNRDGSPIRPRSIKGRITGWNALLQTGTITELDLTGSLHSDAPKFQFDGADYECSIPSLATGLDVVFCLSGNPKRAKRIVHFYVAAPSLPAKGRIRQVFENHGFLNDSLTGESIYFHLNSLVDRDLGPGDLVSYKCVEEPPVSFSAGKKAAISITRCC
mmetsp:Transcript_76909/g.89363  ORF Transcript_76909/g.89363 Transcript_76909/m.89363 type:complete len:253 (-) Transcript_76909:11-769(-)